MRSTVVPSGPCRANSSTAASRILRFVRSGSRAIPPPPPTPALLSVVQATTVEPTQTLELDRSSPMSRSAQAPPETPARRTGAHPADARTVGLLVGAAVFVLTQLYAAIPLLGPVGDDLGGDVTFALATCFSLCYATGFLIWGPVSDQYGRKKVMTAGLLVLSAATLACAFTASVAWLGALRGVQGLAAASFAPTALAYLSEAVPPHRRAGAIGAMSTA